MMPTAAADQKTQHEPKLSPEQDKSTGKPSSWPDALAGTNIRET